ncbi:hypothetical protein ACFL0V_05875, partial [Nanoarchaeota archaeon]
EGRTPNPDLMFKVGMKRTQYLFEKKISHILDADSMKFVWLCNEYCAKYKYRKIFIHVKCPEELIIKRLRRREEDPDNSSRGTIRDYFWRKEIHKRLTLPEIFYTVDNSKELDPQIDGVVKKLKDEGVI